MKKIFLLLLLVILALGYFFVFKKITNPYTNVGKFQYFKTDLSKKDISLDELLQAGPKKDDIPALTNPKFISVGEANIDDQVVGVLISYDGVKRFYPYNILVWHQIVNDSINNLDFAVSFCPLCGSAIVFDRNVDGKVLEFGVSGFLYDSNLVMYDKQTESLWSQAGLKALVGDYIGTELKVLSMELLPMSELRQEYPDAEILSVDTGYDMDYDFYPYGKYNLEEDLYYRVSIDGKKFPPRDVMYVVPFDGKSIALRHLDLKEGDVKLLQMDGYTLEAIRQDDTLRVLMNGEELPGYYEMWFSWATHHQEDGIFWDLK